MTTDRRFSRFSKSRETDTLVVPGVYGPNRHWRNARGTELYRSSIDPETPAPVPA